MFVTNPATKTQNSLLINGVNIVLVFITLVGTVPTLFSDGFTLWSPGRIILYLACSALYLMMGIFGWAWLVEQDRRFGMLAYFIIQIALVTFIIWLTFSLSGTSWILMMPIAGQSIGLPRWGTFLVPTLLIGGFVFAWSRYIPIADVYEAIASISVGILFTMIFTYVAVREEEARRDVERLASQLQAANQQLREYAVQAEELATTKERNRLAREIHDSLGHFLTVINVQLEAAKVMIDSDAERARDALDKSQKLAQEGLQEVRRSVAALRESPIDRQPLPEAVDELLRENRAAGMVVDMQVLGEPRPLDSRVRLTIYRVAQEGLTNSRKHARASRVDVTLDYRQDSAVSLTISDNGIGAEKIDGGFGLLGLHERVELLNGNMVVKTSKRSGFSLQVTLPTSPLAQTEKNSHGAS